MAKCSVCNTEAADIRIRTDDGAYGPIDVQTCRPCHEMELADRRAEIRRLGFRLPLPRWDSLSTDGFYSSVR